MRSAAATGHLANKERRRDSRQRIARRENRRRHTRAHKRDHSQRSHASEGQRASVIFLFLSHQPLSRLSLRQSVRRLSHSLMLVIVKIVRHTHTQHSRVLCQRRAKRSRPSSPCKAALVPQLPAPDKERPRERETRPSPLLLLSSAMNTE